MLLIVSLGPLLTAGFVNVNRAMDRGKKAAADHFSSTAQLTANAYSDLFDRLQLEIKSIARLHPADRLDLAAMQARLDNQKGLLPSLDHWPDAPFVSIAGRDFRSFFIALPTGRVYYTFPYRNVASAIELNEHDWLAKGLKTGGVAAGSLPALTGSNRPAVVVTQPLLGTDGRVVGYLGAVVDTQILQQVMARGQHTVEAHQRSAYTLLTPAQTTFNQTRTGNEKAFPPEALSGLKSGMTAEFQSGDAKRLVTRWAIGQTGWSLVRSAPTDFVYRFVHALIPGSDRGHCAHLLVRSAARRLSSRTHSSAHPRARARRADDRCGGPRLSHRIGLPSRR